MNETTIPEPGDFRPWNCRCFVLPQLDDAGRLELMKRQGTRRERILHIRVDDNELNSQAEFACGIVGVANLPAGDIYVWIHEARAERSNCPGCNPDGPRPLGTPISQLSGRPGEPGYEEFCRIARSWGYD